jgi:hypothetical protein
MASLDISHLEKRNLGLFLNFKSVKCPESGKEKNREVRNPDNENSRTTGTGRDVRLSPSPSVVVDYNRQYTPYEDADYPFGFGINKSAPHMAKNLFHISCLSDMQVSPRSSQDWGRHRGENMEIRIWTTCILYLCITRRPPNILNSTGPFPKSLGNDNRKQYNLDPKKSFGFDRPPYHFPSWGVIVGGLADRLDWILHCVVAVL